MSVGHHFRGLREAAGLSRTELAWRAGVPASTLQNWESDRGFPGLPAALRLAKALGVPVERFADGGGGPCGGRAGRAAGEGPPRPESRFL
jgi:transcriptional regulator with XRE-family HTH domain